jgi:hypothetical protein
VRIGWRRGTRAFVVGITLLTLVIALAAGRTAGSNHPRATIRAIPSPALPANCTTATVAGSRYTVCEESTPVAK